MAAEDDKIRRAGQHAVVTMPTEIDVTNADEIRQTLLAAASHDAPVLIIDMSGTTFCDSAGVQAIIAAHKQAEKTGTQLRLVTTACCGYSHSPGPTSWSPSTRSWKRR